MSLKTERGKSMSKGNISHHSNVRSLSKNEDTGILMIDRDIQQTINIGPDIEVRVMRISEKSVRLAIKAPKRIRIYRNEIYTEKFNKKIKEKNFNVL